MTPTITYHRGNPDPDALFSILIPSWNNLPYLRTCVESIRRNSSHPHQIIVHINEGSDGSLEWVRQEKLDYSYSPTNAGVCYGFNAPGTLATTSYIVLSDDDFYFAPGWDAALMEEINRAGTSAWCISGTMIEHTTSRNTAALAPFDFGKTAEAFDEKKFLLEFNTMPFADWSGSNWYPLVMPKTLWTLIGGLSTEFSPGMGSDPDMMMKLWHAGVRYYKGTSRSRVYHFGSRTTARIIRNNGNKQFLQKWGMAISTFYKFYLRMGQPFQGMSIDPPVAGKLKMRLWRDRWKKRLGIY